MDAGTHLGGTTPSGSTPKVHFITTTRERTSWPIADVLARLRINADATGATLSGPRTSFHALTVQGKSDAYHLDGAPPLVLTFAHSKLRRPPRATDRIIHAKDWLGVLLKCEAPAVQLLVTHASEDASRAPLSCFVLQLRVLTEAAAVACEQFCRFGCNMLVSTGGGKTFDTCCKQCVKEKGHGHDGDCRGAAPAALLAASHEFLDLTALLPKPCGGATASEEAGEEETEDEGNLLVPPTLDRSSSFGHGSTRDIEVDKKSKPAVSSTSASSRACSICFDDLASDVPNVCAWSHCFCSDCLRRYVQVELEEKGVLPACPLSSECGHLLSSQQVNDILGDADEADACRNRFQLLEQRVGLQALGAFPCAKCEDWMVPPQDQTGKQQLAECPGCSERFCSLCRRRPYHFRASCERVPKIEAAWHEWLRTERDAYITKLAATDGAFQSALHVLKSKKAEQDRMLKEADSRKAEFDQMEEWKIQHCKCCPQCQRVIEKLDGCDSMICGQNFHGGEVQNGCGARFNWSSAPAYTAQRATHIPKVVVVDLGASPVDREKTYWPCGPNAWLRCAMCKKIIEGPLFMCIDCHACCACIMCANGTGSASGGRHLPDSHVFEILWEPSELQRRDAKHLVEARLSTRQGPERSPTQKITDMGYSKKQADDALAAAGGRVERAVEQLLAGGDTGLGPICTIPGCGKPTWNGRAGSHCSRECRDSLNPTGGASVAAGPALCCTPSCGRKAGRKFPTCCWDCKTSHGARHTSSCHGEAAAAVGGWQQLLVEEGMAAAAVGEVGAELVMCAPSDLCCTHGCGRRAGRKFPTCCWDCKKSSGASHAVNCTSGLDI